MSYREILIQMINDRLAYHTGQPLNALTYAMMEEECEECLQEFYKLVKENNPELEVPKFKAALSFDGNDMCIDLEPI